MGQGTRDGHRESLCLASSWDFRLETPGSAPALSHRPKTLEQSFAHLTSLALTHPVTKFNGIYTVVTALPSSGVASESRAPLPLNPQAC